MLKNSAFSLFSLMFPPFVFSKAEMIVVVNAQHFSLIVEYFWSSINEMISFLTGNISKIDIES